MILFKIGETHLTIQIKKGEINVKPVRVKTNATLEMSPINFLRIFLGLTSPLKAYIKRELKISGLMPNLFVLKLIKTLQLSKFIFFLLTEHF